MTKKQKPRKGIALNKNNDSITTSSTTPKDEQYSTHKINTILVIISLVIALLGGIPGIINVIDYFGRSAVIIDFDRDYSIVCGVKSKNENLNGRLAVLLYRMTVTGKGIEPSYIKKIKLELKSSSKWIGGEQFIPNQRDVTDYEGVTKKALTISVQKSSFENIYVGDWIDFTPGEKSISYGEPSTFSYAAVFNIDTSAYREYKELKINVSDYLGNNYSEIVNISEYIEKFPRWFLIQDSL